MNQHFFHALYMRLATSLAQRSHCIKKKVGSVITRDSCVVSLGYNSLPARKVYCDEQWPDTGCPRSLRGGCMFVIHAEQNAILHALQNGIPLEGTTLYVTLSPCLSCARLILSVGIKSVYYTDSYAQLKNLPQEEGVDFLKNFEVQITQLPCDERYP